VACLTDADCVDATLTCVASACRTKCASDRTCTPLGLLCDLSSGSCVRCIVSADCPTRQSCQANACGAGGAAGAGGTGAGGAGGSGTGGAGAGGSGTGGSGTGGALFFEDFETGGAARWSPSVVTDWTLVPDGSLVYAQGITAADNTWHTSAAGDPTWTDVAVEARVKWLSGVPQTSLVAVCARYQDPTNFYWAGIGTASPSTPSVFIRRRTGAVSTRLIEMTTAVTPDVWHTVKLQIVGTTLTMFLDGAQVLTAADTMYASGKIAVATFQVAAEFDDVRVTPP
jgi:pectate lyase